MERIKRVQYQAGLAITGCWRGSNQNKIYEELGWESLSDRRWYRRQILMYKIHTNRTPDYLRNSLTKYYGRPLRNNNIDSYQEIMCNTSRYKNSFFPDAIRSWNIAGSSFSFSKSINLFKVNLSNLIRPMQKTLFGVHDTIGVKYLFQLRVGLSPLKFHKKHHNFADTLNDWCDCHCAIEDISHFLFFCTSYALPRMELVDSVMNILISKNFQHLSEDVDTFLYRNNMLSKNENKAILLSTIKFVKETNNFF